MVLNTPQQLRPPPFGKGGDMDTSGRGDDVLIEVDHCDSIGQLARHGIEGVCVATQEERDGAVGADVEALVGENGDKDMTIR